MGNTGPSHLTGDAPSMRHDLGRRQHRVGDAVPDRLGAAERLTEQQFLGRLYRVARVSARSNCRRKTTSAVITAHPVHGFTNQSWWL